MKHQFAIRPTATRDVDAIAAYLADRNISAARRFLDNLHATLDQLAHNPLLGAVWDSSNVALRETRVWQIKGFPNYLVFYLSTADSVEIFRVLHGARDIEGILRGTTEHE